MTSRSDQVLPGGTGSRAQLQLSRTRIIAILAVGSLALLMLLALGAWQLERLAWKEQLLSTIAARIEAPAVPIDQIVAEQNNGADVDYRPVVVTGQFDHRGERYFLATYDGNAGWHVYTPLRIEGDGGWVFVNRGFIGYDQKDRQQPRAENASGLVTVSGLVRVPRTEKPSSFVPDNDPSKNVFFWRNIGDMSQGLELDPHKVLPFFVDAGRSEAAGPDPIGGVTVVDMPNNHLQYAITWFSLAAALAAMLALFIRHLVRMRSETQTG